MKRGDVIEVNVNEARVAYLQDVGPGLGLRLVRFLPGVHDAPLREGDLAGLVAGDALYVAHCLVTVLIAAGEARVVARLPVPAGDDVIPAMVVQDLSDDWREWWVRDVNGESMPAQEFVRRNPSTQIEDLPRSSDAPGSEYSERGSHQAGRPRIESTFRA
jgi:hypothetical protein